MEPKNEINSISLSEGLNQSDYPPEIKDKIKLFLAENVSNYKNSFKLYLTFCFNKKIFVLKHVLIVEYQNKMYEIYLLMYIPVTFPNELRIYIEKVSEFIINEIYTKQNIIDFSTLELNYKNLIDYKPLENPITSLIEIIYNKFLCDFPLYKTEDKQEFIGPCFLDTNNSSLINLKDDDLKPLLSLNELRKNVTEKILKIMNNKALEIQTASSELEKIEKNIDQQISNSYNEEKSRDIIELENIVSNLKKIEYKLENEVNDLKHYNKSILEYCKDVVRIKDEKRYKFTVMKKTIEVYLFYIKKGLENKLIKFEESLKITRKLTKELFFINYIIEQRNNI